MSERELEVHIAAWTLVPGKGGVFEFSVNGELLYSKLATGRHAEHGEIRRLLVERITSLLESQL